MDIPGWLSISVGAVVVLGYLLFVCHHSIELRTRSMRVFQLLIISTIVAFVSDSISRCSTIDVLYPFAVVCTYARYILYIVIFLLYFRYLMLVFDLSIQQVRGWAVVIGMLTALMMVMLVGNVFAQWLFYFDAAHDYHRSYAIAITLVCAYLFAALMIAFTIYHRHQVPIHTYKLLLLFPMPALILGVFQTCNIQLPMDFLGMAFSLIMGFVNILNRTMSTDYLTGAKNRRYMGSILESYQKMQLHQRKLSVVMIDIDDFKLINDRCGHLVGDQALADAVCIMRDCVRADDTVMRFGGDEFLIIISGSEMSSSQDVVKRIDKRLAFYNKLHSDYQLHFSYGSALYDDPDHESIDEFMDRIDRMMYEDKRYKNQDPSSDSKLQSQE